MHVDDEHTADAICTVIAFRDRAGARADLRFAADIPSADRVVAVEVPAVPGAVGTDLYSHETLTGRNVTFADGRYEYLIGFAPETRADTTYTKAEIAAAAARWYDRVKQR